jgi:hypothetical protein
VGRLKLGWRSFFAILAKLNTPHIAALGTEKGISMKRRLLILAITLFSFNASACKCAYLSVSEAFEQSKAVMLVEIQSMQLKEIEDTRYDTSGKRKVVESTFTTIESFKQAEKSVEFLSTFSNCGLPFYPGQKYVVFVPMKSAVENSISVCTGSFQYRPQLEFDESRLKEIRESVPYKQIN